MNNILKTTAQSEDNTPSFFVVCKESMDNEVTHGIWIDCTQPSITIQKEITEMLAKSSVKNAKDWEIVKTMNLGEIDLSCSLVSDIHMIAKLYTEFGEMFANFLNNSEDNIYYRLKVFTSGYKGIWNSATSYLKFKCAQECKQGLYSHQYLHNYVDYELLANEAIKERHIYAICTDGGKFHIIEDFTGYVPF